MKASRIEETFWNRLSDIHRQLTPHQLEVVRLYSQGMSVKEIAEQRGRTRRSIADTLVRAGNRVFGRFGLAPGYGALAAWYVAHRECCADEQ